MSKFRFERHDLVGIKVHREVQADAQVRPAAALRDELGAQAVPDFGRNRTGNMQRSFGGNGCWGWSRRLRSDRLWFDRGTLAFKVSNRSFCL